MQLASILLVVASAAVFYILIGYPLLLAIFGRTGASLVAKDLRFETTVSAILAVHNGGGFIRAKLESLLALDYPKDLLEIVVVSDGSTDDTEAVVTEFSGQVLLLSVPRGGKAAAINHALHRASGKIVFFTDVRQPLDRSALRHLVANFADPRVGAVSGEMQLLEPERGEQADMDLYWRYEVWARKRHSSIDSVFNATGCIYAMRRELAAPLPPDTLTDDAVLPLRAFFKGYRVVLDPEAIAFDYPAVANTEFRRRMRTLAGLWQVHARLPQLFTAQNRMRFHFLSHKFSRLVLPWAVLLILASTIALPPSPFRTFLLLDELVFILLAFLDCIVPENFLLKRLTSPARTFVIMNAAALAAVSVFFVPATRLWLPTRVREGR